MSKMSRLAQEQQERYADNYLADEAMRHHDIARRITALEKSLNGNTTYERSNVRRDATALTEYLRENGYPKQPEPTQSDDVDF